MLCATFCPLANLPLETHTPTLCCCLVRAALPACSSVAGPHLLLCRVLQLLLLRMLLLGCTVSNLARKHLRAQGSNTSSTSSNSR
jgi:hypothetical protein